MRFQLLVLLLLPIIICRGAGTLEAPPGFHSQRFGPWGGEMFVPDSWHYREPGGPHGGIYMIAKEFSAEGTYDTGMRIRFIPDVKKNSGFTPKEAADLNVKIRREHEKVLSECPPEKFGVFTRICLETIGRPVKSKPQQEYHIIYSFWWSDQLDMMAGVTFGAPVEEWDSVRSVYQISGNIKILDADRVRAEEAPRADGKATDAKNGEASSTAVDAAPAHPAERDATLDPVVKVGALQFVNRLQDIQWRIGRNPEALFGSLESMRKIIAGYLIAQNLKKPAVVNAMIGMAPKRRLRVWLTGWNEVLAEDQRAELTRQLESVVSPEVRNGPVALSLTLQLNGAAAEAVNPQKMKLPEEWLAAIDGKTTPLPDGLPESIWSRESK